MLQSVLLKAGLPLLFNIVKDTLLNSNDETVKTAGKTLQKLNIMPTNNDYKNAIDNQDYKIINTINKSLQTETISNDKFVRRMRPTFGYIMAFTWLIQMTSIPIALFMYPQLSSKITSAFAELSMMWSVGLSVLGVYVYKRSNEKLIK